MILPSTLLAIALQYPVEVSVGPAFTLDPVAFGVMADVAVAVSDDPLPWAVHVAALGTGLRDERSRSLQGSVVWTRPSLALGVRARIPMSASFAMDLDLHALWGVILVEGEGFPENRRSWGHDVGAGAGDLRPLFRLGRALDSAPLEPLSLWLGIGANGWLRTHTAVVNTPDGLRREDVPKVDILLLGGLSWGFGS